MAGRYHELLCRDDIALSDFVFGRLQPVYRQLSSDRKPVIQRGVVAIKTCRFFRKPLSILSDRGIQFCSWNGVTAFQLELKALTIDHLLAREQHPETTGKIEAFHKTIKRELLTTTEFFGIQEARERIHDYIMFYNFSRPHMGIDNAAPAERYFKSLRHIILTRFTIAKSCLSKGIGMALTDRKQKKKKTRERDLQKIKALEKQVNDLKKSDALKTSIIESIGDVNRILAADEEGKKLLWTSGFPHNVTPEVAEKIQEILKKTQKNGDGKGALLKRVLAQDSESPK